MTGRSKLTAVSHIDNSDKNCRLIFQLFPLIGISFCFQNETFLKKVVCKITTVVFNLFSIYYAILFAYHCYTLGFNGHHLIHSLQFFLASLIRFKMAKDCEIIAQGCKSLLNRNIIAAESKRPLRILILLSCLVNLFLLLLISVQSFIRRLNDPEANGGYMLFGYSAFNTYLLILTECLTFTQNWIEFITPGLSFVLISWIYHDLGNIMNSLKSKVKRVVNDAKSDLQQINHCVYVLSKTSNTFKQINDALTMPVFYLMSLLMIQSLVIITQLSKQSLDIEMLFIVIFIQTGVFMAFFILVGMASRISEDYSDLKNILVTSDLVRKKLFTGKPEATGYLGLLHVSNALTSNFTMTAMGALKIEKSVIITMLCGFISYGVILSQML